MSTTRYLTQCLSGEHTYEVVPNSSLEQECIDRSKAGILDAFILSFEECPACIEENRSSAANFANSCNESGCAMTEECRGICLAVQSARSVPASQYEDQLENMEFVGSVTGVFLNGKPLCY